MYVSSSEVTVIISVAGSRLMIRPSTGWLFLGMERPKSPRTTFPSQMKYASYHGLSSP